MKSRKLSPCCYVVGSSHAMLELVVSSQLHRAVGYCTSSQLLVIIVPNCLGTYHFLFPTEVPICRLQITTMFTRYFHIPNSTHIILLSPMLSITFPMVGNNLIFPIHYHIIMVNDIPLVGSWQVNTIESTINIINPSG